MSGRDPEADRYELQAQRERHDELGRALYEKRRPDAPKTWAELDEAARTEWTLVAVDQQGAVDTRRQREIAAQALAIARAETGLTPPTEGFGRNGYPVEHASNAVPVDSSVPDLAEKLRRVWLGGKPIEPGGRIDWTRFAEALITDEGVRPR